MNHRILTLDIQDVGWKSSFQIKRGTTRVSIKKDIAVGLALRKGQPTFGYLARDLATNRSVVFFFMDGKERDGHESDGEDDQ